MASIAAVTAAALTVSVSAASAAKLEYGVSPQTNMGAQDFSLAKQANVDVIRVNMGWDGIQPAAGNCTATGGACAWDFYDLLIGGAAAEGIETLPALYGSPRFVANSPYKPPVKAIPAWQEFVTAAVQRYGPGGAYWNGPYQAQFPGGPVTPVGTWQLWNEPTSLQFFKPEPNTKQYVKILKPAADAIRSADGGADIMLGGVFGETGPKGIPLAEFFKDLYKVKKIEKSFDAVAIHPYAETTKALLKQVGAIVKATKKGGDGNVDVWVTELGYSAGCKGCKKNNIPPVATKNERTQAKALTSSMKALKKKSGKLNLAGIIWFTWQDLNSKKVCNFCRTAGLLDFGGGPKPAYNAFTKAAG